MATTLYEITPGFLRPMVFDAIPRKENELLQKVSKVAISVIAIVGGTKLASMGGKKISFGFVGLFTSPVFIFIFCISSWVAIEFSLPIFTLAADQVLKFKNLEIVPKGSVQPPVAELVSKGNPEN